MHYLNQETDYRLIEKKRLVRGVRNYEVFTDTGTQAIYTIEEKASIFKRLMRFIFGDSMAAMRFEIKDTEGAVKFRLRKGIGPANTTSIRLLPIDGTEISRVGNPLKFKDDSFIEVFNPDKKILFKSGLSHRRRWYPIHVYRTENAQADWLSASISGEIYVRLRREDSRISASGNEYSISFTEAPASEEELINMVNFAVTADYYFDHRHK